MKKIIIVLVSMILAMCVFAACDNGEKVTEKETSNATESGTSATNTTEGTTSKPQNETTEKTDESATEKQTGTTDESSVVTEKPTEGNTSVTTEIDSTEITSEISGTTVEGETTEAGETSATLETTDTAETTETEESETAEATTPAGGSLAVFEFGENVIDPPADGKGYTGKDGSAIDSGEAYTSGDYTLTIIDPVKVYDGGYDAKGNSALKMGTTKDAGSFKITVPENVQKIIVKIAKYKDNKSVIIINGTEYTLEKESNAGEYDVIEIDTSSQKTVIFETGKSGKRCLINSIEFIG